MADESANRRLKIEAHDASRVEWSMYIPLPRDREISEAEVSFRLEFPENVYVPHGGWEQLQILARLSSPDEESAAPEPLTVDGLRRSALGVARRLKLLRESIPRAAVAHSLNPIPVAPSLAGELEHILDQAVGTLGHARAIFGPRADDPPELGRERALADEFLSGQLLELLTVAEETCARMLAPAGLPGYRAVAQKLRGRVADTLSAELHERERRGEMLPDGEDVEALALFLDRAAQLKKHFQEVLFLEPETKMIDEAVRNWVGLSGAATAFIIYFGLQALQTSAAAGRGAVQRLVTLDYRQRARVTRLKGPSAPAFERLKIVFRYDLAPILTRLDDSVKRVPVPAGEGVRFADAPRLYRVPLSLRVSTPAGVEKREALIVLNRRGIARIVPEGTAQPVPPAELQLPELDDNGVELLPQA